MTRVVVDPDQLRRVATTLNDATGDGESIARQVLGVPMPEMPAGVAGAIRAGVDSVSRRLTAQRPALEVAEEELRVRAFWGDIADAQSECRTLTDAQVEQMFQYMSSGALLRYGATPEQAQLAGRMLAGRYRDTFEDPAELRELAALLRPNAANADFAGAFIDSFGTENFTEIPRVLQAMEHPQSIAYGTYLTGQHMRGDVAMRVLDESPDYDGDENILDVLAPFTQALAVSTYAGTLARVRQEEIVADDDQWAVASLLSHEGAYGKDFLLDAFETGVVRRIEHEHAVANGLWQDALTDDALNPLGWTSDDGGLPRDSKAIILAALSHNPEAAATALTTDIEPLELRRLVDSEYAEVTNPADLLLEYATYGDDGRATGQVIAAANDWFHDSGQSEDANRFTLRLVDEVINGEREDLDGLVVGLADDLADHHVEALHESAATGGYDYDEGGAGAIRADNGAIALTSEELLRVFQEVSGDEGAQDRLLGEIGRHQAQLIAAGTAERPTGPENWAYQIGSIDRLMLNANDLERLGDYEDAIARHERVFQIAGDVAGLLKVNPVAGLAIGQGIDFIGESWPGQPSESAVDDGAYDDKQRMILANKTTIAAGLYENGQIEVSDPDLRRVLVDPATGELRPFSELDTDGERAAFEAWLESNDVRGSAAAFYGDMSDGMYDRDRTARTGG